MQNDKFYVMSNTRLTVWNYPNNLSEIYVFNSLDISLDSAVPILNFDEEVVIFFIYYLNSTSLLPISDTIKVYDFSQELLI